MAVLYYTSHLHFGPHHIFDRHPVIQHRPLRCISSAPSAPSAPSVDDDAIGRAQVAYEMRRKGRVTSRHGLDKASQRARAAPRRALELVRAVKFTTGYGEKCNVYTRQVKICMHAFQTIACMLTRILVPQGNWTGCNIHGG